MPTPLTKSTVISLSEVNNLNYKEICVYVYKLAHLLFKNNRESTLLEVHTYYDEDGFVDPSVIPRVKKIDITLYNISDTKWKEIWDKRVIYEVSKDSTLPIWKRDLNKEISRYISFPEPWAKFNREITALDSSIYLRKAISYDINRKQIEKEQRLCYITWIKKVYNELKL